MSTATLKIVELDNGLRRFEIDCRHGTTEGLAMGVDKIGDAAVVAGLALKHFSEERCRCTRQLRKKYPPSLLPKTLWLVVP